MSSRRQVQDREFTEFFEATHSRLFHRAFLLTGTRHDAEDLVQKALVKTYSHWPKVNSSLEPLAYVHRIMLNTFLSDRRRPANREFLAGHLEHGLRVSDDTSSVDDQTALITELTHLAPLDRAVLVLRYFEDRSVQDTAHELDLSADAVKARSRRALAAMRRRLGEASGMSRGPATTTATPGTHNPTHTGSRKQ